MFSLASLNHPSIVLAGLIAYALGALWEIGFPKTESGERGGIHWARRAMVTFGCCLLFCYTMALVVQAAGAKTPVGGALVGLLIGGGLLAPLEAADKQQLHSGVAHRVVLGVVTGSLLAAMR